MHLGGAGARSDRVLIVDDERMNIDLLVEILSPDYDTMVAKSGEQALRQLQAGLLPDLVLLDVMMPGIDGYEVCRRLKADPGLKEIPVIFITALDRIDEEMHGLELGAVDYIIKPFSPALVSLRVRNHLKIKRQSDVLKNLANLDGLTGVPNRRRFDERLDQEWAESLRQGTPLSLIIMDIDCFKAYNDLYGHLQGDDCLRQVANALHRVADESAYLLARYGGEEFVCLLPGAEADACQVAHRLYKAVQDLNIPHAGCSASDHVSLSLGAASLVATDDERVSLLVNQADRNLYLAKERGRNRCVC